MAFLQAQMSNRREWYEVDGSAGLLWIPAEDFTAASAIECYDGQWSSVVRVEGWGVRASAPGYLDCTPWIVYENEKDAMVAVLDLDAELGPEPSDLATREGDA